LWGLGWVGLVLNSVGWMSGGGIGVIEVRCCWICFEGLLCGVS
jgi:hypothetical protein